jgi:hypothetical protein
MHTPQPTANNRPSPPARLSIDEGGRCDEHGLRPYRQLAVSVLARALLDLASPAGLPAHRESARMFLAGSGMLSYWCGVAALDPSCVVKHAERLGRSRVAEAADISRAVRR